MNQEIKDISTEDTFIENVNGRGLRFIVSSTELESHVFSISRIKENKCPLESYVSLSEVLIGIEYYEVVELTKRQIADLYEMKLRKFKTIGYLKKLERLLLQFITLLFGLCSSQSSLIFRSFFGPSLFRSPAL